MDELDSLTVGVRADTTAFAADVARMRSDLQDGLGLGAARAGRSVEGALLAAVRSGKTGFDDLKGVALKAMDEIAAAALKGAVGAAAGGGGGLASLAGGLLTAALGLPGRATGGPVKPGAAYMVGERGPELFVPTASGAIVPAGGGGGGGGRDVRVSIAVNAAADAAPQALARSGRQLARAVARALQAEG